MLHAIIMAGGSGTRFWPASRKAKPKQLLALSGSRTMIQATCDRLNSCVPSERISVITATHLVDPIAEQLPELRKEMVIGEPCRRDTAPCVGLAAALVAAEDPDGVMLVCPSDHVILKHDEFADAVRRGEAVIAEHPDAIITFGIRPSYPAESFGYIQQGAQLPGHQSPGHQSPGHEAFSVECFREKPDRETAEKYVAEGNFLWNSGIFLWKAKTILDALAKHEPAMHEHLLNIAKAIGTDSFDEVLETEFTAIDGKSIDYAVMERHDNVVVIEAPFDWDDVGSWQAVSRLQPLDAAGNAVTGSHIGIDSKNCIIQGEPGHTIVTIDTEDLIIVQTGDATLVAPRASEERVREAVAELDRRGMQDKM